MFRKPRNDVDSLAEQLGRPPSPPSFELSHLPPRQQPVPAGVASPASLLALNNGTQTMSKTKTKLPLAGGNATRRVIATTPKGRKANGLSAGAGGPVKANQSILSFFKKTESPTRAAQEESLFVGDTRIKTRVEGKDQDSGPAFEEAPVQVPTPPKEEESAGCSTSTSSRFNEHGGAVKKRKTGGQLLGRTLDVGEVKREPAAIDAVDGSIDETIAEDSASNDHISALASEDVEGTSEAPENASAHGVAHHQRVDIIGDTPSLTRESTSAIFEDFGEDDFLDEEALAEMGEEFLERRYAEEQRRLEEASGFRAEDEAVAEEGGADRGVKLDQTDEMDELDEVAEVRESRALDSDGPPCPVCNITLAGITAEQASTHVNNCLDGRPTPLPKALIQPPGIKSDPTAPVKRFIKAAIARPGQQNPFSFGEESARSSGSAFSKLMSGHAEDTAWATAAANEVASRGKPAFKRTCPFYKILPGFSICVDAFRYGAVQGCSAYFLSHFHSDHYIGLTSSWCHGPIYCSKVTANLVRQQLRVDAKHVIPLNFEEKVEIPGTKGVFVTMIPANHCPGSSLFLYEKEISRGPKPKIQRILHCGDFRACPAHVHHPLLRPDVQDAVTGKHREQKLDVCYLDTTYLTPKYAFPLQHEVIQACADMCVSLSKDRIDDDDGWEKVKRERAGAGMVKFVRTESQDKPGVVKELDEDGNVIHKGSNNTESAKKNRGRLLVVVGTYSIGKERICLGVAKALNSKIYATAGKQRICAALEDPELSSRLTSDPLEAQVHMQMIMEIRAETLADYLASYKPHFSRVVGFRPSGWNYRPPNSRFTESPLVGTVLHSENWKSRYSMAELMPQRGSTREASCFGVPYSEHSSFRELTMFCCALRIDKIVPTVNIGSAKSRERMKGWFEKWEQEKKKNGLFRVAEGAQSW